MGAGVGVADTAARCAALLARAQAGDGKARDELIATFYERWRERAHRRMGRERADHTLQATAVLHEALIPLLQSDILAEARSPALLHFAVSRGIEQVLVRHARSKDALKRSGGREPLDDVLERFERRSFNVGDVARELEEVAGIGPENERRCDVLRLKVYGGYTVDEIAGLLGMSKSAIEKDLRTVKALLRVRLEGRGNTKGGRSRK